MKDLQTARDPRRKIPPVNQLVDHIVQHFGEQPPPHELAVRLARILAQVLRSDPEAVLGPDLLAQILAPLLHPGPKPVINGTGILLHTNLGRAPLRRDVVERALDQVSGYTDLEIDLTDGKRGHRDRHFADLARLVWGVEDGFVVNNAAAAVTLSLAAIAAGGQTVVSRGELSEIGGSFRLPDIMKIAGTQLVEVGTTNKTRLADYEEALCEQTACLLKTHPSNFRIEGFTAEVLLADLVTLGKKHDVPVIMDLGSGLSRALAFPVVNEPFIEDYWEAGPDVLMFSGDKLFGGIQAGIVLGRKREVELMRRHPMMRMLRADKLSIAVVCRQLADTVMGRSMPLGDLANATPDDLERRARVMAERLPSGTTVIEETAQLGGGSLPGERCPSVALLLNHPKPARLARLLRCGRPAVMGYVRGNAFRINLAAVFPHQDEALVDCLLRVLCT